MNKEQTDRMDYDLNQLECCFETVLKEFGNVYAIELPTSIRIPLLKAAVLRWVTEELTCAVQRHNGNDYERNKPVEGANSASRMAYAMCVCEYSEQLPSFWEILSRRDE